MSLLGSPALFQNKTNDRPNASGLPSSSMSDSDNFDPIHCLDSPFDAINYEEDRIRLKLQELEQVLLKDDETDHYTHTMDIDSTPDSKNLLFECSAAIHNGNLQSASRMFDVLRRRVSIQGGPADWIAAYMVEALAARMATSGRGLYRALKCKDPASPDIL